jgi:cephalosporin-C deacetylase-like acetyl esterase
MARQPVLGGVLALFCLGGFAAAQPQTSELARGQKLLDAYWRSQTRQIADACLSDIKTRNDWEKKRPELRRQFLEMIGLWPLPPRTDLRPVITRKLVTDRFTVEKLYFQSSPELYVTANLYVPKLAPFPAPAVLYLCGHSQTMVKGVAFGSKVSYQHHARWFAEHGYVCLILDTLELGEIPGTHHGTSRLNQWWWQTVGYTPAGIECWNAMRALDYLETRREVDAARIGVTGRSGGGATTWWLAAADDRPRCMVAVAGFADLWAHVVEGGSQRYPTGVIGGHCDCMYFTNAYRWDFPLVAALAAPRPLMLQNSTADEIFPIPGYQRLAGKVRRLYDLYGAGDRFTVVETPGPHKDTPPLRLAAYGWMEQWLKGSKRAVSEPERPRLAPSQLKVLEQVPDDAVNAQVQETWIKPADPQLPEVPAVAREWWAGKSKEWLRQLETKVFSGWPAHPPPLSVRAVADIQHDGLRLRAFDFTSEEAVDLRLWLLTAAQEQKPSLVVLTAVDETGWQEWLRELGPPFKEALLTDAVPNRDADRFVQNQKALAYHHWAFATLAPRGIGPTRWTEPGSPAEVHVRRRFPLLGQTLDGQRVWDVRRGIAALGSLPELAGVPLWLQGQRDLGGIVLYAAIFEPRVARTDLWYPPASHRQGPTFLNVRRFLDMPQAVALVFPRRVGIQVKDEAEAAAWRWPEELQRALGAEYLKIRVVGD